MNEFLAEGFHALLTTRSQHHRAALAEPAGEFATYVAASTQNEQCSH